MGFYLRAAVMVLSVLTRALRYRAWLAWHRLSYGALFLVAADALGAGTDRWSRWMLLTLAGGALALVMTLKGRYGKVTSSYP